LIINTIYNQCLGGNHVNEKSTLKLNSTQKVIIGKNDKQICIAQLTR